MLSHAGILGSVAIEYLDTTGSGSGRGLMKARAHESAPTWLAVLFRGNVSPSISMLGRVAEWQTLGT